MPSGPAESSSAPAASSSYKQTLAFLERRATIMPSEVEDLADLTVGEAKAEHFMQKQQQLKPKAVGGSAVQEELMQLPKEVRNIVAGGVAGMIAKSVVAPFDRIKILYQVSSTPFQLRQVPQVASNIVRNEGVSALWRGNLATLIRVFPYSGIQFAVFDRCKTFYLNEHLAGRYLLSREFIGVSSAANAIENTGSPPSNRKFGLTPVESLLAGMTAGTVSVVCTYPLDLTRAQLAVIRKHRDAPNKGFLQIIMDNYRIRGFTGLFRGITPTLLGILPYSGIAFALNEQGKREIQHLARRDLTTMERMQCGALAGLVAQTVTYPIEVCRRRMQTIGLVGNDTALNSLENTSGSASTKVPRSESPLSLLHTIRSLYVEQGIRGFFKGVSMNWMKGPIAFSISFTAFDTVQSLMESETERALKLGRRFTKRPD